MERDRMKPRIIEYFMGEMIQTSGAMSLTAFGILRKATEVSTSIVDQLRGAGNIIGSI